MRVRERNLERALELVHRAEKLNPAGRLAYLDTEGWALFKLGRHQDALERIQAAIRHMTIRDTAALSESMYHLGKTLAALGRVEEAEAAFRRAWRLGPSGVYGRKAKAELGN